jgi:hypothetical protein
VPAFAPVRLRARADGWTPVRQAAFLGALAVTGSVGAAARRVGMSRVAAYRLRKRPGAGSFAAAWDKVLRRETAAARKVTRNEEPQRALHGLLKPLIYAGRHVATVWKPDNSALLRYLGAVERGIGAGVDPAADVGSFTYPFRSTFDPGRAPDRR